MSVNTDTLLSQLNLRGPAGSLKLIEAITDPPVVTRTIDGASTLSVIVSDYDRTLLTSGILDEKSWAVVDKMNFELVSVSKSGDRVTLTFEDSVAAELRRQTKPLSAPAGSTTRREFVARLAKEAQIDVAIDDDKRSVVHSVLERSASGQKSDSWTLLGEVADAIHWRRFSDGAQLVVGSDDWLMGRSPKLKVFEHTGAVHDIDFDLDVAKKASTATIAVDSERWAVPPGRAVSITDLGPANGDWLVSEFTRTLTQQRATVKVIRKRHVLAEPKPAPKAKPGSEKGVKHFLPGFEGTGSAGAATAKGKGPSGGGARERMVQWALAQRGKPYVWGASGPGSFDCSGLVQEATRAAGKTLVKPSGSQYAACARAGRLVSVQTALATRGALLFGGPGGSQHIAISLGNGSTMEAMGTAYGCLVAGNAGRRSWSGGAIWL